MAGHRAAQQLLPAPVPRMADEEMRDLVFAHVGEELFGHLNSRQREYVGDIISAGRHLLTLIDALLERARVEGNRVGGTDG